MDPITLILTALTAGATAAAKGTLTEMGKDAYQSLKDLVQRRLAGKKEAELALAKYEEKPTVWETPLKDALVEVDVDQDEKIIKSAQNLLTIVDPQQAAMGKYNVQITGNIQGLVQGDNAQVTMTFDSESPER